MTAYLVSVLVVAVSLTIAELVIPNGRLKNTVQTVLAIIFISVMLTPIVNFDYSAVNFGEGGDGYSDAKLTAYVDNSLEKYYEKTFYNALKEADLIAEKINVEICNTEISKITIYLSNLVIEENNQHINITVITNYVAEKLNVSGDILTVYA